MGEENKELIVNEKKVNWTKDGLVQKKEPPKKDENKPDPTKPKEFKIFDDMNIFRKPEAKKPEEDPEEKRKKEQAKRLANMMFAPSQNDDLF